MRFLETLLLVFAAIYVAQLLIASLIIVTLMLFLWCLYKRPREALVLGLAALAVIFISRPAGFALTVAIAAGVGIWALIRWRRSVGRERSNPRPLLGPPVR